MRVEILVNVNPNIMDATVNKSLVNCSVICILRIYEGNPTMNWNVNRLHKFLHLKPVKILY